VCCTAQGGQGKYGKGVIAVHNLRHFFALNFANANRALGLVLKYFKNSVSNEQIYAKVQSEIFSHPWAASIKLFLRPQQNSMLKIM
jgi:hypothetical protein